jgi:hypothetical protein
VLENFDFDLYMQPDRKRARFQDDDDNDDNKDDDNDHSGDDIIALAEECPAQEIEVIQGEDIVTQLLKRWTNVSIPLVAS